MIQADDSIVLHAENRQVSLVLFSRQPGNVDSVTFTEISMVFQYFTKIQARPFPSRSFRYGSEGFFAIFHLHYSGRAGG
jgi:hypothetical protein